MSIPVTLRPIARISVLRQLLAGTSFESLRHLNLLSAVTIWPR